MAENHHHCGPSLAVILRLLLCLGVAGLVIHYCVACTVRQVSESAENRHRCGPILALILQILLLFLRHLLFFLINTVVLLHPQYHPDNHPLP